MSWCFCSNLNEKRKRFFRLNWIYIHMIFFFVQSNQENREKKRKKFPELTSRPDDSLLNQ